MRNEVEFESFELWEKIFTYDGGVTFYFSDFSEQCRLVRDYYQLGD